MKKYKIIIIIMLFLVIILGVVGYIYYKNDRMVPILSYHVILPSDKNEGHPELIIDAELFEEQLKILKKNGI